MAIALLTFTAGFLVALALVMLRLGLVHPRGPGLCLVIGPTTNQGDSVMIELDALQQFRIRVTGGLDRKGNPAALENIAITSSDEAVAVVGPTDDGGFLCRGVGEGSCDLKIEADADIGDGVTPISKLLPVAVKAPEAVDITLEIGELENQP